MRNFLVAAMLVALAACGSNKSDEARPAATVAAQNGADSMASDNPAGVNIADSQARPIMQAQVVLERQGFGPGVIDGKMGISTVNALTGFQQARGIPATGKLDAATQQALAPWREIPATRIVRIPADWGKRRYAKVPKEPEDQAKMQELGYQSLDERLAERFHTTPEVLDELNPGGQPAGAQGNAQMAEKTAAGPVSAPSPTSSRDPLQSVYRAGQLVRVPNIGADRIDPAKVDDKAWQATLASLGVGTDQPHVSKVVVDRSGGWLKGYDAAGKLVATFTVTTGSRHDPLPLGTWGITTVSHNPHFNYNPDLFWDADASDTRQHLPPGPNGPVGVVWIDLTKPHYGIHGTSEPQTIGRTQSHGCVRLTNWDAARLAQMVDTSTKVVFQA
jgi:lipoprotein-anchoring transpeptidase ErfK/SrfK